MLNRIMLGSIIGNLRIVQIAVTNLYVGANAQLCEVRDAGDRVPVVVISHDHPDLAQRLGRIFVYSAVISENMRGYTVVIEFVNRPNVVAEKLGLGAALSLIRDALMERVTPAIDSMTRGRFELDFEALTSDSSERELIDRRRAYPRDLQTGLLIQHVTFIKLSRKTAPVFIVEQLGSTWDGPTEQYRLISLSDVLAPSDDDSGDFDVNSALLSTHDEVVTALASLDAVFE